MSILSDHPDGMGFYYGWLDGDHRQINIRFEERPGPAGGVAQTYVAYVGGEEIPRQTLDWKTKAEAEQAAIDWARANPEKD